MPVNLKLVTPPTVEPVSLSLAKSHMRVDINDDDALIATYLIAARQAAEKYTRRAFFNQAYRLSLDHFPNYIPTETVPVSSRDEWPFFKFYWDGVTIRLPRPSTVSVESITYVDLTGTLRTLDPSTYYVDTDSEPARIVPTQGMFWPFSQQYLPGSVKVNYIAGSYGDGTDLSKVPQTVVIAILMLAAQWYKDRENAAEVALKPVPQGFEDLLATERFEYIWG